ncbi:hypothetical protein [Serratia sp. DD3]|uniref:hypothetical protein n=1 Tax=Serratia sp. DD3 TaxID=1410619 RepID=UPI0004D859A2|nr:hypothetical protein [Serratia sp. DD3]KEY57511.1 hypothetical protein SRDD_34920 [Serratia sp. DD3]
MKKVTSIILTVFLLASLGNTANSASSSEGNFSVKPETLSADHKLDIKTDLISLNTLMKAHNSDVAKIQSELSEAGKKEDTDGMIKASDKIKSNVLELTNLFKALTVKSQEIQEIRMHVDSPPAKKQENLLPDNPVDIKDDLVSLNKMLNTSYTKTENLLKEHSHALFENDKEAERKFFEIMTSGFKENNNKFVNLNIKSKKIQDMRDDVVTLNKMAIKLNEYYKNRDKLSEAGMENMRSHKARFRWITTLCYNKLDKLNTEYMQEVPTVACIKDFY